MGIFYNALDGPITTKKVFGIITYLVISAISVWATAESLNSSFDLPKIVTYAIAIAIVMIIALLLGVIKDTIEDRRIGVLKLLFVIVVFLILWAVSLSTNTHKLFTQLKLQDIRKNELNDATIALETIEKNKKTVGDQVIEDYRQYVSSRIIDYKEEVKNPENCGHGKVADSLMSKVQKSMPGFSISPPSGRQKNESNCRKLANEMAARMFSELDNRITSMNNIIKELDDCNDIDKRTKIILDLKKQNNYLSDLDGLEVKQTISDAHEYYNQLYECYNTGLVQNINSVDEFTKTKKFEKKLELPVPSFKLEKIPYLIPFVKNYPKEKPGQYLSSFWLSVAIALVLDVAAFIIFYFVILKEED
ncbi:hypothetical protein [Flavivirga eckloniae]|uniref:DUF4407 domain-containing protein n=1 Tax=Flavivirga eckloniae TaxID=1803846 RepID=A0A2K9PMP0_9FLAO|nr:hypothetical protein [Flavivirga eckloniae]AUP78331.1 hypothetical protein C1H87_06255 [Flavivirga eckloniae]